jgi:predicted nucleotidyltransferase
MNKKQSNLPNFPPADQTMVLAAINNIIPSNNFELFVFGSRSLTQTCKHYSDLDLVIRCDKPIPRKILFQIEESLEESKLSYRVDLIDWHLISDEFKNEIISKLIKI